MPRTSRPSKPTKKRTTLPDLAPKWPRVAKRTTTPKQPRTATARRRWVSFEKSYRLSGSVYYVFTLTCGHTIERKITPRMANPQAYLCRQCQRTEDGP